MEPLDLINHIRKCSMDEFHKKLERLQLKSPEKYEIVADLILSCKPRK